MQIQVWFSNDHYIDIKLFDNNACAKWFEHFSQLNTSNYYDSTVRKKIVVLNKPNKNFTDQQWDIILNALAVLKSMGFTVPFEVPATFDCNQNTLNLLHRFFTYNALWYRDRELNILNPFDNKFELPKDMSYNQWLTIINPINAAVHKIEDFTLSNNKKLCISELPISTVVVFPKDRNPTDLNPWTNFNEEEQQSNYTYFDYDLPLVVLDRSILGKCVLQSFYEDDDPNARDCTGRVGSYGGFHIDLNNNRKKIYQSDEFKSWITKHNIELETLPLEFPVGYVVNYEDVLTWIYAPNLEFKKIVFVKDDNK